MEMEVDLHLFQFPFLCYCRSRVRKLRRDSCRDRNAVIKTHPEERVLSEPVKSFLEEEPLLPKVVINSSEGGIKLTLKENENSMCDNNLVNLFSQLFEKSPVDPDKLEALKRHCVLMNSLYIALSKST
ncbi:hypothetical protein Ocin01_16707 [Orchesella cincta]|uniref:Uncharacterized protein n=1 Tax=Orchesella cincta TaxID=48709 RepID=A0A1D2MAF5_ORCCI|nr:hypothetical protein Ocin01_16707 [Orchesella cincta]